MLAERQRRALEVNIAKYVIRLVLCRRSSADTPRGATFPQYRVVKRAVSAPM